MDMILQTALPEGQEGPAALPGMGPCAPDDWLRCDEVYAQQMALRGRLLDTKRDAVLWMDHSAHPAAVEVLQEALKVAPALGFERHADAVRCPDGRKVVLDWDQPLLSMGLLFQEDICILQKRADQHVLTGAVLCFPASWRLADKVGRPLTDIHTPVAEYDPSLAKRVQRLFDGVQAGRPLWRHNWLTYTTPDLHQPTRKEERADAGFVRSERQCIVRMPRTQAVIFSIHTWVVARAE